MYKGKVTRKKIVLLMSFILVILYFVSSVGIIVTSGMRGSISDSLWPITFLSITIFAALLTLGTSIKKNGEGKED
jgi:hypothetical protein